MIANNHIQRIAKSVTIFTIAKNHATFGSRLRKALVNW